MTAPNPIRTLESHGVIDQGDLEWHQCPGGTCHMMSIRTNSERVKYVEQCSVCGWIDGASLDWWVEDALKNSLTNAEQRMAMTAESEPFAFTQTAGEELTLQEVLFQALGAASVCWEEKALLGAGVFDSARARAIGEALLSEVMRFQRLAEGRRLREVRLDLKKYMEETMRSGALMRSPGRLHQEIMDKVR